MKASPIVYVWGHGVPQYKSAKASGADLCAYVETSVTLKPFQRKIIPTNTYIALPEGYEGQIRPRSGLSFHYGITLINAVGTIDADYRGELCIPLINLGDASYTIEHGERIAQLIIASCARAHFKQVKNIEDLPSDNNTHARLEKGFGSTGRI